MRLGDLLYMLCAIFLIMGSIIFRDMSAFIASLLLMIISKLSEMIELLKVILDELE